jgi:hypothetical protein
MPDDDGERERVRRLLLRDIARLQACREASREQMAASNRVQDAIRQLKGDLDVPEDGHDERWGLKFQLDLDALLEATRYLLALPEPGNPFADDGEPD